MLWRLLLSLWLLSCSQALRAHKANDSYPTLKVGPELIGCGFPPPAYQLRKTAGYRTCVMCSGSIVIAQIARIWLLERAFDLKLI